MEGQTIKTMSNEQLIGACVWLDREQKKSRTLMNSYKAELQARGLAIMEDHNTKYVKFYGDEGSAAITDSMSLDILNPDKLKELVGEGVYKMKVKEETKTNYKFDSKFEKALKAIFTGDFTFETTLEEFLDEMTIKPDDKQKKLLLKKLKGEFPVELMHTFGSSTEITAESVRGNDDFSAALFYYHRVFGLNAKLSPHCHRDTDRPVACHLLICCVHVYSFLGIQDVLDIVVLVSQLVLMLTLCLQLFRELPESHGKLQNLGSSHSFKGSS